MGGIGEGREGESKVGGHVTAGVPGERKRE